MMIVSVSCIVLCFATATAEPELEAPLVSGSGKRMRGCVRSAAGVWSQGGGGGRRMPGPRSQRMRGPDNPRPWDTGETLGAHSGHRRLPMSGLQSPSASSITDQWEASIQVTWSVQTNQSPVSDHYLHPGSLNMISWSLGSLDKAWPTAWPRPEAGPRKINNSFIENVSFSIIECCTLVKTTRPPEIFSK